MAKWQKLGLCGKLNEIEKIQYKQILNQTFMAKSTTTTSTPAPKPNPNYPSTTVKPSGGGRGNTPKK